MQLTNKLYKELLTELNRLITQQEQQNLILSQVQIQLTTKEQMELIEKLRRMKVATTREILKLFLPSWVWNRNELMKKVKTNK